MNPNVTEPETDQSILKSLWYYDNLRLNATGRIKREEGSNVDVFQEPESKEDVVLCHLSALSAFTNGDFVPLELAFVDAAAISLAAHQLNVGDGSIVNILDGLNDRCNVRFTVEFADTQGNEGYALDHVVHQIGREAGASDRLPCAFIGAYGSAQSIPTSIVTGLFGYPQVSGASTSSDLDETGQHRLFARTIPSDSDNSIPIIIYLREVLQVTRLAVIHVNDPYGNAFVLGLENAAREYAPDMDIHNIPLNEGEGAEKIAVESFKETEYRYVFCLAFTNEIHDNLLTEAFNMGVAGDGKHNWFFGDSFMGTLANRYFEKDSPLHLAYRGVGLLEVTGGLKGMTAYDTFTEWMGKLKNPDDLQYLGSHFPEYDHPDYGSDPPFIDDENFLSAPLVSNYAAFFYEATIALGLAACSAISGDTLDGETHFRHLADGSFTGVSGKVSFDAITGTRDVTSAMYRVSNWLPNDVVDTETGETVVEFTPYTTDIFQDGEWSEVRDFIFNDGTTNLPPDSTSIVLETSDHWAETILVPVAIALVAVVGIFLFFERKRKQTDALWYIKKEELKFSDPPDVIGRGAFGLILKAEYRGTEVAIKGVLPPRPRDKGRKFRGSLKSSSIHSSLASQESQKNNDQNLGLLSVTDKGSLARKISMTGSVTESESVSKPDSKTPVVTIGPGEVSRNLLRKNFIKEMRYLSKMRHSCIATVMGAVLERGSEPMLVMEYMDHGSLYDVLHNETMHIESNLLLHMLQDVSQGVRFLHSSIPQVIHGDLKAANILVDSRFRAKVTDFGLSQDKGSAGCAGTPFWMAPELLSGQSGNTMASDVYSFGIILYEIFSRRDPYDGEDPATVLHLVADELVQKRPPTPKTMPAQIQSIMKDSVQHEADNRPTFQEVDMRLQRMDAEDLRLASSQFSQSFGRATSISLFDIFPRHVAKALREGREVEAEHRDMVTIFFSDIVGFTQLSSELPARKVAVLLDRLYTKLDALSRKHDVFKVETIGDAYMAVTNLVKDQEKDHAKRIAEFAIDAIKEANETLIDEDDPEKGCVNIRVGFHSGSVVADVVGTRNLRYCLFGDSVNTASRMESNSKSNRIHCSCASAEILAAQSPSMPLKSRGLIPIKGKGEMHTFWINEGHKSGTFSREDFEATMIDWAKEQHKDSNERRGSRRRQNAANFLLRPLEMLNRPIEMLNRSSGTFDKSPKLSLQGKDLRAEIGNMSIHEDSLFMSELELRLDTAPPQESFVEK